MENALKKPRPTVPNYPVREGIGLFLLPDLPRNDLWEQAESQLSRYLREHTEAVACSQVYKSMAYQ